MPINRGKGKGIAKLLAVLAIDNKPKFSNSEVQQLPIVESILAIKVKS